MTDALAILRAYRATAMPPDRAYVTHVKTTDIDTIISALEARDAQIKALVFALADPAFVVSPDIAALISADTSQQINALITAWEHASIEARKGFLYMIGASVARTA